MQTAAACARLQGEDWKGSTCPVLWVAFLSRWWLWCQSDTLGTKPREEVWGAKWGADPVCTRNIPCSRGLWCRSWAHTLPTPVSLANHWPTDKYLTLVHSLWQSKGKVHVHFWYKCSVCRSFREPEGELSISGKMLLNFSKFYFTLYKMWLLISLFPLVCIVAYEDKLWPVEL